MTRFYEAPAWRMVVTDLDSVCTTWLDHLASDRTVTYLRDGPTVITGVVPADNPEVNIVMDDGEPFLAEGLRFIYAFRREDPAGTLTPPWVCRAAGLVMQMTDASEGATPTSTFAAYDPWKYLYRRPVMVPGSTDLLPEDDGVTYRLDGGDEIILDQLALTDVVWGEFFVDYGQTAFYTGTFDSTAPIDEINFARGSSLGEMLDALVATGTLDVWFEPIYDPVNRPGMIAQLNVFDRRGGYRPEAVFGWDSFPKNVVSLNRVIDGSLRMNQVLYYAGQGGLPSQRQDDAVSIARFGHYFEQRFWPGQTATAAVEEMAATAVRLLKNGQRTYALSPASERAPIPLTDYEPGDVVPVYGTNRLRAPINELLRVDGIPIVIGSDMLERVNGLLVSEQVDVT